MIGCLNAVIIWSLLRDLCLFLIGSLTPITHMKLWLHVVPEIREAEISGALEHEQRLVYNNKHHFGHLRFRVIMTIMTEIIVFLS